MYIDDKGREWISKDVYEGFLKIQRTVERKKKEALKRGREKGGGVIGEGSYKIHGKHKCVRCKKREAVTKSYIDEMLCENCFLSSLG